MKSFLSIPTFRSMKYLHGVLLWLAIDGFTSLLLVRLLIVPDMRGVLAWAVFVALAFIGPVFGFAYRSVSSNQY